MLLKNNPAPPTYVRHIRIMFDVTLDAEATIEHLIATLRPRYAASDGTPAGGDHIRDALAEDKAPQFERRVTSLARDIAKLLNQELEDM